jgi:hypothetical protein
MESIKRRQFVIQCSRILAFIPLANITACISDTGSKLSSEDSLKKLIYIVGPWTVEDQLIAEDFANRFLESHHAIQYLSNSVDLIQSLSKQISEETIAVDEINLDNLPEEQQQLLIDLSKQIYSFVEVRFYVANEPPWGVCQGNPRWHTRIPE